MLPIYALQSNLTFVNTTATPVDLINKVIAYAILAAFILSVVFVFYGGFRLIFSGGDETKVKQATGTIRHAIIGLVVTILATFIVSLVGQLFGLDVIGELLDFNQILASIQALIDRLSGHATTNGLGGGSSSGIDYNFSSNF